MKEQSTEPKKIQPALVAADPAGCIVDFSAEKPLDLVLASEVPEPTLQWGKGILFASRPQANSVMDDVTTIAPEITLALPYFDKTDSVDSILAPLPIRGWGMSTAGKAMEAAGLTGMIIVPTPGRLTFSENAPVLAFRIPSMDEWKPASMYQDSTKLFVDPLDIQKIALFDYLLDYRDRHAGTILVREAGDNGEGYVPFVVMPGWSCLQYMNEVPHLAEPSSYQEAWRPSDYVSARLGGLWLLRQWSYDNGFDELALWWMKHRSSVYSVVEEACKAITNKSVREHVWRHFVSRYNALHIWSNEPTIDPLSDPSDEFPAKVNSTEGLYGLQLAHAEQLYDRVEMAYPAARVVELMRSASLHEYTPEQMELVRSAISIGVQECNPSSLAALLVTHRDDRSVDLASIIARRTFESSDSVQEFANNIVESTRKYQERKTLFPLTNLSLQVDSEGKP